MIQLKSAIQPTIQYLEVLVSGPTL